MFGDWGVGVTEFSIVIPVYRNAENVAPLLERLGELMADLPADTEVVFVVDGSPDHSYDMLAAALPGVNFRSQLLQHSRNFGSFAAIPGTHGRVPAGARVGRSGRRCRPSRFAERSCAVEYEFPGILGAVPSIGHPRHALGRG
jgi:hypothetical protein